MRWAQAEESKTKAREIEILRDEIHRLNITREESLESQRRDLTQTFESLLYQREESFVQKEREIAAQISTLDHRFEQLQTENSRLKSELSESLRKCEILSDGINIEEEKSRQLQWRLDDERLSQQQSDDSMQRRIQQLQLELSVARETIATDALEHQRRLEKVITI